MKIFAALGVLSILAVLLGYQFSRIQSLKAELASQSNKQRAEIAILQQQLQDLDGRLKQAGAQAEADRIAEVNKQDEFRKRRVDREREEEARYKAEVERQRKAEADPGKLVIEGAFGGSFGCYERSTKQRFLAWRKGDYYEYTFAHASIEVKKVISGTPPEIEGSPRNKYISVFFLNDVALALKTMKSATGRWNLTTLPDGTYAVLDLKDTPFAIDPAEIQKPLKEARENLASTDPKRQILGLRAIPQGNYFNLISTAISLMDSKEVADGEQIGDAARRTVSLITVYFRKMNELEPKTKKEWESWWAGLLATDPFPVLKFAPGELKDVVQITTDQSWPEMFLDPQGRFGVCSVERLDPPLQNTRSGLRFFDFVRPAAEGTDDFIYKVPLDIPNREPRHIEGASTDKSLALAWTEYDYDPDHNTVRFMSTEIGVGPGNAVDLELKRVRNLALSPISGDAWLLAYTYIPPEGDFHNPKQLSYGFLILDKNGKVIERPAPLAGTTLKEGRGDGKIQQMIRYKEGIAILRTTVDAIVLHFCDEALTVKKSIVINGSLQYVPFAMAHIAANKNQVCVVSTQNLGLVFQTIALDGYELSPAQPINGEQTHIFGGPVACGNGFVAAWLDNTETPNQIRASWLVPGKPAGPPQVLCAGKSLINPIILGASGNTAMALFYDFFGYPKKVKSKQFEMGNK